MKKPILGMAFMLGAACAVCGQQGSIAPSTGRTAENAAAAFSDTSAAQVNLLETDASESRSFALATPGTPEAAPIPAAPAPKPKFLFGNRDDYRWQLALGVEFLPSSRTSSTPVWSAPTPPSATSLTVGLHSRGTSSRVLLQQSTSTSM